MTRTPSAIDAIAERYVRDLLDLSPETVTSLSMPGADEGTYSDYSPAGRAELTQLARTTLRDLESAEVADDVDAVTLAAMRERLGLDIEMNDAGEDVEINNISTPLQGVTEILDLMGQETADDWALISRRLGNIPGALAGWQESICERVANGPAIPRHQIELAIEEATRKSGSESSIIGVVDRGRTAHSGLGDDLEKNGAKAREAFGGFAAFLTSEVLPSAVDEDGVGRDRYNLRIRRFVGASIDLDETYEWGHSELDRIVDEQEQIARELYGDGVSVREAMDRLNEDPERKLHGTDALREWMQTTSDTAIDALRGTHFDIPEPMTKLECMIAPSGTGAIYYTGPSDDFSRPGRMWWSVPPGTETFTTWQEKTTVYHEGVPGHHLQVGYTTYLREQLNTWRRHMCWVSGHGEGWALYAEGLMRELGFMDEPGDYMGVLDSERLRTARVVLDIGVHLAKPSPEAYRHISPIWNRDVAYEFLKDNVAMDHSFLRFELNRYLGWAGQAPSYKVGHRIWTDLRSQAQQREGADFDLKAWHTKALSLGSLGLDVMKEALA